jgi:hypothetical protein
MAEGRWPKRALKWMPEQKRARGRSKKNWMEGIKNAMNERNNPLAPSDPYMGRTAQLTSRRCILNAYSTNIRTEYFKDAA